MKIVYIDHILEAPKNSFTAEMSSAICPIFYETFKKYYPDRRHLDRGETIRMQIANVVNAVESGKMPKTFLDIGCGANNQKGDNTIYEITFEPWLCRCLQRLKTESVKQLLGGFWGYTKADIANLGPLLENIRPERVVGIDCEGLENEEFETYTADMIDPQTYDRFEPHSFGVITNFASFNSPKLLQRLTGKQVLTNNSHPDGEREFEKILPALDRILHPDGVILRSFL